MKWYRVLSHDNCIEGGMIARGELCDIEEWQLEQAIPVTSWQIPTLEVKSASEDGDPDDALVTDVAPPIFSPRLQRALLAAGIDGIQYLPVRIRRSSGLVVDGFAVANVLSVRKALDPTRSTYSVYPGDHFIREKRGAVRAIQKYTLDDRALKDCDLLRLEEYKVALLCSERVKLLFEEHCLTGWGFELVDVTYTSN
jgi:hypothetical protein